MGIICCSKLVLCIFSGIAWIRELRVTNFVDIKVKEPTLESLTKKKKEYMPPRFMSVSEASQQLLEVIKKLSETENISGK